MKFHEWKIPYFTLIITINLRLFKIKKKNCQKADGPYSFNGHLSQWDRFSSITYVCSQFDGALASLSRGLLRLKTTVGAEGSSQENRWPRQRDQKANLEDIDRGLTDVWAWFTWPRHATHEWIPRWLETR